MELLRQDDGIRAVSPMLELGAYEALWARPETTFHRLANRFRDRPGALPSDFVDHGEALEMAKTVVAMLREAEVDRFDLRVHGTLEYPERLRDAKNPVEVLYFMGWWSLVSTPCVAVVGSRKPTDGGIRRARKLTRNLVADGWTIVSGLADGIDTIAHTTAIESKGFTIGVLGTPLNKAYPRKNAELQKRLARDHLVISQVPVYRYSQEDYRSNRAFFPQRNYTMAALSEATILVEAGETSGTLVQARGALQQGRKLFILDSCFRNPKLDWPHQLESQGAIRVRDYEDFRR
ncbi:MAG: DNA-processing protein DprA, partial [bacterium]|nr:DNA-processing protein DprA [bacterium]